MKSSDDEETNVPHLTKGSVLDDLGFSSSETLEMKVKADVYREMLEYIREQGLSARKLAAILEMHQPDVSNLLHGKISKFSVGKLIQCAGKLQLGAQVKLTKPKARRSTPVPVSRKPKRVPLTGSVPADTRKAKTNA